jgi:hypothetical protein
MTTSHIRPSAMDWKLEGFERKVFAPVGRCIYCDATADLTDEHIVPLGLDGFLELPDASCKPCAKITSLLELSLLRGEFWALRLHLAMTSRRKHQRAPTHFPVEITREGTTVTETVPREACPVVQQFPLFPPPRLLTGEPSRPGIDVEGAQPIVFGDPQALLRQLGGEKLSQIAQTRPAQFGRFIAKIALGMAEATGAIRHLAAPAPVREVILGTNPAIGDYVGTLTYPLQAYPGQSHRIAVIADQGRGWLIGDVQLFSASPTPRYGVLLGPLRSD